MKESPSTTKKREDILNQDYVSAQDLKILIPTLGVNACRNIIKDIIEEMKIENKYVPPGRTLIALTTMVKKKLGLKEKI